MQNIPIFFAKVAKVQFFLSKSYRKKRAKNAKGNFFLKLNILPDQLVMFSLAEKDEKSLVRGIVEERRSATIAAVKKSKIS